ncbi:hypothetical protein BJ508DRAFT_63103 [Ascobolus immersus RN42]|uniref:Uncharacterized protein n=1 Tax=Ascobolus immersus RN42 TaxID=1160509 RepID=A0A3N4IPG1_ASCIM|nr:hypothetical protein BJ508DRAFT_63103 [Ascobolus immersus RN42]
MEPRSSPMLSCLLLERRVQHSASAKSDLPEYKFSSTNKLHRLKSKPSLANQTETHISHCSRVARTFTITMTTLAPPPVPITPSHPFDPPCLDDGPPDSRLVTSLAPDPHLPPAVLAICTEALANTRILCTCCQSPISPSNGNGYYTCTYVPPSEPQFSPSLHPTPSPHPLLPSPMPVAEPCGRGRCVRCTEFCSGRGCGEGGSCLVGLGKKKERGGRRSAVKIGGKEVELDPKKSRFWRGEKE